MSLVAFIHSKTSNCTKINSNLIVGMIKEKQQNVYIKKGRSTKQFLYLTVSTWGMMRSSLTYIKCSVVTALWKICQIKIMYVNMISRKWWQKHPQSLTYLNSVKSFLSCSTHFCRKCEILLPFFIWQINNNNIKNNYW